MALKLVTVGDVRERMQLPDVEVVNTAIERAVRAATIELRSALRMDFDFQGSVVDRYYVDESLKTGGRFFERFLLSRGLVTETLNDVEVREASRKINLIDGGTDFTDLRDTTLASGVVSHKDQYVTLSSDGLRRGLVLIEDFRLIRRHVQITYDAGITPDRNKPTDRFLQAALSITAATQLTFATGPDTIIRDAGNWTDDQYRAGDVIQVSGTVSNNVTATIDTITTTTITDDTLNVTPAASGSLVAEGPTAGFVVDDLTAIPAPDWLQELATLHAMWELLSDSEISSQSQGQASASGRLRQAGLRPEQLKMELEQLLDQHSRYEPAARMTTT